jgi:hypothetical protein
LGVGVDDLAGHRAELGVIMRVVGDLFEAPHELLLELDVVRVPGDVALRVLDGLRGAEQPDDLLLPRANELLSLQGAYFDRLVALGASPSRRGALRLNPSPIAAVPDELDVLFWVIELRVQE